MVFGVLESFGERGDYRPWCWLVRAALAEVYKTAADAGFEVVQFLEQVRRNPVEPGRRRLVHLGNDMSETTICQALGESYPYDSILKRQAAWGQVKAKVKVEV